MRALSTAFLLVVIGLSAAAPCAAQGKTTVDPNTPDAKTAGEPALTSQDEDTVFARKVTYDGPDLDLTTMLSQVSDLSGVKLLPSQLRENWQVRQRMAIVFANDVPLSEFKDGLAKLLSYRWSRVTADNGKRSYVLIEPETKKTDRQDKIDEGEQAKIDARREGIRSAVETAVKSSNLTPQEIREAREKDPWLYYLATNETGKKWAEIIRSTPPDWWEQPVHGKTKSVMVHRATDPTDVKIIDLLEQIRALPLSGTAFPSSAFRSDPVACLSLRADGIYSAGSHMTDVHQEGSTGIWKCTGAMGDTEACPIGPSDSPDCLSVGYKNILMEDGTPLEQVEGPAREKVRAHIAAANKKPEPDSKTDPALLKEIEHSPIADPKKKDEPPLIAHLRGLAKETGFTVMMETFDDEKDLPNPAWAPGKTTTFGMLSELSRTGDVTWEKNGNAILLRYKNWPDLRSWEVSKDLIKRWEDAAKAHGYLTFDDLYDIAKNTTGDQVGKTLRRNKLLNLAGIDSFGPSMYYPMLKMAAMLPDDQRPLLLSKTGLSVKIIKQLDLASDPVFARLQSTIDRDENAVIGVYTEEPPSGEGRERIQPFVRDPDGNGGGWPTVIGRPADIKAVQDYLKSLEQPPAKN